MEIFGVGLPELLMIAVVALVVLGPDRLPEAARTLGKAVADLRRAMEPARSAWADVNREITAATTTLTTTTATTTASGGVGGNPWSMHPLAEGLSEEEQQNFFQTGALPDWKQLEVEQQEIEYHNGNHPPEGGELEELDYPMPHSTLRYRPAPPFSEEADELDYPEPGQTYMERKGDNA